MPTSDIGIDLGTRNSLAYSTGKGLVLNEPSIVVYDKNTEKIRAIGEEARLMEGRITSDMEIIRPIRQGVIVDYTVTEKMLKYFISRAIGRRAFRKPRISICVPSGITEIEKKAVEEATYQAGARDVYMVEEPIAAAIGAYALASPENDVTLTDLAELSDVFYIGGTKCGALFGEAVVIPQKGRIPHFFTIIKQHGALLAKGRIAGIQFGELFTDGLYLRIGKPAMEAAEQIKDALKKYGYQLSLDTPTNQIFCIVSNEVMKKIAQDVEFGFWEKYDETHSVIRFATSWATTMEDTQKLIQILEKNK